MTENRQKNSYQGGARKKTGGNYTASGARPGGNKVTGGNPPFSSNSRGSAGKPSFAKASDGKSVYAEKRRQKRDGRGAFAAKNDKAAEEFEQRIVDIARVTRVMAGGKRMRFRACVALGNKKGKVAIGLSKGADVTIAVTKAVNKAKKNFIEVPIVNGTIPHEIYLKMGAARVLLKPARMGKGVIAGGASRIVLELAGIKNVTSKNLGTNNKVNIARCTIEALGRLKRVEKKTDKKKDDNQNK